jgi:hypothetical protein
MPITDRLARYDAKGSLSCLVCKTAIAHDALWKAHVLGREHAQAIERLREKKAAASASALAGATAPPAAAAARYACMYVIYLLTDPTSMRNAQCARPFAFACAVRRRLLSGLSRPLSRPLHQLRNRPSPLSPRISLMTLAAIARLLAPRNLRPPRHRLPPRCRVQRQQLRCRPHLWHLHRRLLARREPTLRRPFPRDFSTIH